MKEVRTYTSETTPIVFSARLREGRIVLSILTSMGAEVDEFDMTYEELDRLSDELGCIRWNVKYEWDREEARKTAALEAAQHEEA